MVRPLLDALVQSTTVELFQSRGIAVAPMSASVGNPHQMVYFSLAGVVSLTGAQSPGSLSLSFADGVFDLFSSSVTTTSMGSRDLLRELTNQLAGRVKNRLLNFTLVLSVGIPTVLSGQALQQHGRRQTEVVYVFRSLRGEVVVTLDLAIAPGTLSYAGPHNVAKEGDFIAF